MKMKTEKNFIQEVAKFKLQNIELLDQVDALIEENSILKNEIKKLTKKTQKIENKDLIKEPKEKKTEL